MESTGGLFFMSGIQPSPFGAEARGSLPAKSFVLENARDNSD